MARIENSSGRFVRLISSTALLFGLCGACSGDEGSGGDNDTASGGTSSSCVTGESDCAGTCVATMTDPSHCGTCGNACGPTQTCQAGSCQCDANSTDCSGTCIDTGSNPANCGACGNACPAAQVCSLGACADTCAANLTACSQACVDLQINPSHCGACENACAPGASCTAGVCSCPEGQTECGGSCVDTLTSASHCGSCDNACSGSSCVNGACQPTTGTGGMSGTGGSSTGGTTGTGGSGPVGECGRELSSCTAPVVDVTTIDMGTPIVSYGGEGDTAKLPLAIAAIPGGGSRVAALGTDDNVHIAELDCDDEIVGTPFSIPAVDLQDIHADENGGVVLVTRNATQGGQDNCGGGTLCGGESSQCYAMWLVRFDRQGNVEWETQVTNLSDEQEAYEDGALFVWWYQHHGRIAFDGENYASYFGAAITVNGSNQCIDIHQGDRMQVVDSDGNLTNHPDSFNWGCSHSWQTRIVWDPRTSSFEMVCTTDNGCRIAQPSPYRTIADGNCNGQLFGGDLVLSTEPGYWVAWSQDGTIRLNRFNDGSSNLSIDDAGASAHPHLVNYGSSNMLLTWESGNGMTAQIRSAGSGETVGDEFSIDVNDHDFQAFKAFDDGSVAYPAAGSSNNLVDIARVMPCN